MGEFENPRDGHIEEALNPWLWALLFGPFYFATKGATRHAVASGLLAVLTSGLSWFVYPFFARRVIRTSYLRRGWAEVSPGTSSATPPAHSSPPQHPQASQEVVAPAAGKTGADKGVRLARNIGFGGLAVAGVVMAWGAYLASTPEGRERLARAAAERKVELAEAGQCDFAGAQTEERVRRALRHCPEVTVVHEDGRKFVHRLQAPARPPVQNSVPSRAYDESEAAAARRLADGVFAATVIACYHMNDVELMLNQSRCRDALRRMPR